MTRTGSAGGNSHSRASRFSCRSPVRLIEKRRLRRAPPARHDGAAVSGVDPLWPRAAAESSGSSAGRSAWSVDARDHVWIHSSRGIASSRASSTRRRRRLTRAVLRAGAADSASSTPTATWSGHWGGPGQGYDWPESNHGITVDYKGNVWIGGNGRGPTPARGQATAAPAHGQLAVPTKSQTGRHRGYFNDSMVLKFTQDGKFLMQIGKPRSEQGQQRHRRTCGCRRRPFVDKRANEVYVADGYGNHRVIVFDADTGKYKRHWGAYGNKPDDVDLGRLRSRRRRPAQQFRNPVHCAGSTTGRPAALRAATA